MADELTESALRYHRLPRPGKTEVVPTKPLATQRDLSLAYSPGVAAACNEIVRDPATAAELTGRANLVAVVTNGTAVLGLGAIGPLAAKPVMEGKGVLFKKFAGIDVFDLELLQDDQEKLVEIVAALEPTFGGINLEDIKAPECFYVEQKLRERMSIPVFHDDQHGTAIIVGAAVLNGLSLVGKGIDKVKLVVSGAGAAALSCLGVLEKLGLPRANMWVTDIAGVVWKGRNELMDPWKERYARDTKARTLAEVIGGADIFLGLSAAGVLKKPMVAEMAARPLIFALANPNPEITPEDVAEVRDDAIMATGRSDYPNQVNNVLCFPYIFRGALDVGAKTINDEMKIACVRALATLARKEPSEVVARAFGDQAGGFGPSQIIPKPFDPRLIVELAPAVAKAAMDSGVATRPIADFDAYRQQLSQFVFKSGLIMRPVFEQARSTPKRVIFSAGEDDRVLRAVQIILDEGVARPILIGRPEIVRRRAERLGLGFRPGVDAELVDPSNDPRYDGYWSAYHQLMERRGVTEPTARNLVRSSPTLIAALAVRLGDADAMIAGAYGRFRTHFNHVRDVIGTRVGVRTMAGLSLLVMPTRSLFIADTYVNDDPDAETLVNITLLAADEVLRFGIQPKVALLSHSSFGSSDHPSARKMAQAVKMLQERAPTLEVDGEMHGDAALDPDIRHSVFPRSRLKGAANLVVCPSLDAANIGFNLLKNAADGLHIGPMLLGTALPAHVLTPSVTARGILNMTALAVVEAQRLAEARGMSSESEILDEVPPELIRRVEAALAEDRAEDVRSLLGELSASGQAFVLEQVAEPERDKLVGILKRDLDPEALTELDDEVLEDVLEQLDSKDIAAAAHELEADDAAGILEDLPEDERREVLAELPPDERADIESALAYPDGTAGRLMQRSLVKVPDGWMVGQVIDHCREATDLPDDVYDIFVVDSTGRLLGSVPLGRMLRTKRPVPIRDIVDPDIPSVPAFAPQAEVAHLFRDMNLVSCPVVDAGGRLAGVIMVDDVVDVIDEEAEADLLKMGGVGIDDMYASPVRTARLRALWLTVNLATAVLASLVIGQFEHSIEKIVALAVLMPIVASMGGNAGTQTVTVAVRALAMGELTAANAFRFVVKEAAVGGLNGLVFALLMGAAVVAWYGDWRLGAVIAAAMICNLLAAALAGTLIPLGLQKFGIDPAVSSTVFLTTVTDVIGFLAFLGLATAFLL